MGVDAGQSAGDEAARGPGAAGRKTLRLADLTRPDGVVPPLGAGLGYVFAGFVALAAILILMASYAALIGLVGWATYWHATNDLWWLSQPSHGAGGMRGRALLFVLQLLAYGSPILSGVIVVIVMMKPIVARPRVDAWPVPLEREDQPTLYAAVDQIADLLGAPKPAAIEVDCTANAAARMSGGQLILRLGLPLVHGLDLRELIGVVAHELGHFRQRTGRGLSRRVHLLAGWLLRAVYDRDQLDELILEACESESFLIMIPGYFARFCVWVSRGILWILAMFAMLVVSSLLRQMEYDADRAQVGVSGVKAFTSTMQRLGVLSIADGQARQRVIEGLRRMEVPDNLTALVMVESGRISPEIAERLRSARHTLKTGLFSTHPADADRVAAARAIGAEGVIAIDAPGTALFRNVEALSKVATIAEYRERLGEGLDRLTLVPVQGIVAATKADDDAIKLVERFFGMTLHPLRALPFTESHPRPVSDLAEGVETLRRLRAEHLAAARGLEPFRVEYEAADTRWRNATSGERLLAVGLSFSREQLGIEAKPSAVSESRDRALVARDAAEERLERSERRGAERLAAALRLVEHPRVQSTLARDPKFDVPRLILSARRLAATLASIGGVHGEVHRVAEEYTVLLSMLKAISEQRGAKNVAPLAPVTRELRRRLTLLRDALAQIPTPLPHSGRTASSDGASLADVVLPSVPQGNNPFEIANVAQTALRGLDHLRDRVAGRVIQIALMVERAVLEGSATAAGEPRGGGADPTA